MSKINGKKTRTHTTSVASTCVPVYVVTAVDVYRASSVVLIIVFTRAPDAGAWGLPVLRGECDEMFVFELSGTHELHTINTKYQVATT